jgi:nicotinamidase-related amidase
MTNIPRMNVADIFFLFIDLQEKLLAGIAGADRIVTRSVLLLEAARSLKVPCLATSQYRAGLGPLVAQLVEKIDGEVPDKTHFSCARNSVIQSHFERLGRRVVVISGVETHICVAQTALDLLELGYSVMVVADAVGARGEIDHAYGLRRMEAAGATLVTAEMVVYELLGCSDSAEFKRLLPFIKQAG